MRKVIPKGAKLVPENAEKVFSGMLFDVYQWQQKMFDDSYQTFEMLKRPDTVKVICIKDGKIIVLHQDQPNEYDFYDFPGGRHDVESEDELEAAKREVLEETGMRFKSWKLIQATQPLGKIEQFVYLFLAYDFQDQVEQHLDAGERIDVLELTLDEAQTLCENPNARYMPKDLLLKAKSVEDLKNMPEIKGE